MKPNVVLLSTGGTIASRYDPAQGRVVPSRSGEDLVAMLPGIQDAAAVEVEDFASVLSFDMSVGFAHGMARRVNEVLARSDVAGVVVTHGTDTMEETSYLADLLLSGDKPAVFTGAQRTNDDPHTDGPRNILSSVRTAAAPAARGLGALLCFNDRIHAARDVTKVHTSAVETFQSYDHGALGEVDGERVVIYRRPTLRRTFAVDRLEDRVDLIRLSLGFDTAMVEAAIDRGAKGLVIEGFGRGNGPAALAASIRRAVEQGVVVVMASRCPVGRVEPIYGFGGGGRDLRDVGALFAGDLKGPKARVLLMVLLSDPGTAGRVREIFGEMAP
jgi:L-asparaginase